MVENCIEKETFNITPFWKGWKIFDKFQTPQHLFDKKKEKEWIECTESTNF